MATEKAPRSIEGAERRAKVLGQDARDIKALAAIAYEYEVSIVIHDERGQFVKVERDFRPPPETETVIVETEE